MNWRQYIEATGAAVLGNVLAVCAASSPGEPSGETGTNDGETEGTDSNGAETGTLATRVTHQPADIDDFESCVVTVEGIWVMSEDGGNRTDTGDDGSETDIDAREPDG